MGEIVIAEQAGALGAQPHHLGNDRLVVGRAAIVAAADEGAKDLLAQIAALRELQERFDAGARQRDNAAVETALLRFGLHRLAHEIGQAGKLGFAFEREGESLLVGQHVLAEVGAQRREAFDDFGKALLRRAVEGGAGAAKGGVIALQHALLLGVEAERIDLPASAHRCGGTASGWCGSCSSGWRSAAQGRARSQQRIVAVGADQQMEDSVHPLQGFPAALRCAAMVLSKSGRLGRGRDGRDLRLMRGKRAIIGWREVLGFDAANGGTSSGVVQRARSGFSAGHGSVHHGVLSVDGCSGDISHRPA